MSIWRAIASFAISILLAFVGVAPAGAIALRIAPISYDDVILKSGEVKKGYVDVTNPDATSANIEMDVQAFRQIDDQGGLAFHPDESLRAGVKLDLDTFILGPHETMRVYFALDGSKLPSGDVFAAIFARIAPEQQAGAVQAVRVGTLLMIQNGTPATHKAEITSVSAPWLQIGKGITATAVVHNPADPKHSTGFTPSLMMSLQPYASRTVKGPLIFAGNSRTVTYTQSGDYFGPMVLQVRTGDSSRSMFLFVATGYWRWLAPLIVLLISAAVYVWRGALRRFVMRRPRYRHQKRKSVHDNAK